MSLFTELSEGFVLNSSAAKIVPWSLTFSYSLLCVSHLQTFNYPKLLCVLYVMKIVAVEEGWDGSGVAR